MARPLRIEYPGAVYHVTSRGNARQPIYRADADRREFLAMLAEAVDRFQWRCHAYCLMGNHYHLLLETPEPNLSRGMRHLNGTYTQRFNRRHGLTGHIFQGRYKAILVEKESHLLELCRYVVLNPVRAGLAESVEQWPWSSYAKTAGLSQAPAFLETAWVLAQFGSDIESARRRYRDFVAGGHGGDPWHQLTGGGVLGSKAFVDRIQEQVDPGAQEVPRQSRQLSRPGLEALRMGSASRGEWMRRAHRQYGYTLAEIASHAGIHYSAVSKLIKRWEAGRSSNGGRGTSKFKT